MLVGNTVGIVLVLLAPVGLVYSWCFYLTRMKKEQTGWRKRVTLLSLALVSLVVLLWPVMVALTRRADDVGWIESWHRPIFRTLVVALVLGLFGRPRLILPIAAACVGTAVFWMVSTMP
jgi:hypothetical protein